MIASELSGLAGQARDRLSEPMSGVYLTVPEVAELARCEHKAVRRAIASGRLIAFRPAHKLLVRELDARAWIESRPVSVAAMTPERAQRSGRQRPRPRGASTIFCG
ncbi:MAG: helix-turn-helix domain-containing protein [Solirubrobacteraceae bacterium]